MNINNTNNYTYTDKNSTSLDNAYKFNTFSTFIQNNMNYTVNFSPVCIFCLNPDSYLLMNDGSLRRCKRCNRNFKAKIIY